MKNLSDDDLDAIAERVLQLLAKRLAAVPEPVQVPVAPPPPLPSTIPVTTPPPKLAYTLKELALELGLSPASIYRLVQRGLLRPLPYLRKKTFPHTEVERFLSEGKSHDWFPSKSRGRR